MPSKNEENREDAVCRAGGGGRGVLNHACDSHKAHNVLGCGVISFFLFFFECSLDFLGFLKYI